MHLQGDIQERLIYRTDIYIDHDIKKYQYSNQDIDYPQRLIGMILSSLHRALRVL